MQDDVVNLEIVEDVSTMEFTPRESERSRLFASLIYIYIYMGIYNYGKTFKILKQIRLSYMSPTADPFSDVIEHSFA